MAKNSRSALALVALGFFSGVSRLVVFADRPPTVYVFAEAFGFGLALSLPSLVLLKWGSTRLAFSSAVGFCLAMMRPPSEVPLLMSLLASAFLYVAWPILDPPRPEKEVAAMDAPFANAPLSYWSVANWARMAFRSSLIAIALAPAWVLGAIVDSYFKFSVWESNQFVERAAEYESALIVFDSRKVDLKHCETVTKVAQSSVARAQTYDDLLNDSIRSDACKTLVSLGSMENLHRCSSLAAQVTRTASSGLVPPDLRRALSKSGCGFPALEFVPTRDSMRLDDLLGLLVVAMIIATTWQAIWLYPREGWRRLAIVVGLLAITLSIGWLLLAGERDSVSYMLAIVLGGCVGAMVAISHAIGSWIRRGFHP